MSRGFWSLAIISVVLAGFAWKSMSAHWTPPLRSEHAEPAAVMPPQPVAVTAEGKHYFVDLNPSGQWGWIEDATALPIAEAIAALLTGEDR